MMFMPVPQPNDGFEWTQAPWGRTLESQALAPHARHFFTAGELRLEDDTEWNAVAACAGVAPDRLRLLRQVHGRTVVSVDREDSGPWERPEADAVISNDPTVALVVRVADCAPVLMADPVTGAVAAVHAGWRSTMQRIVVAAIEALRERYGTSPADLVVAIGPSLGACCGEMGDEVLEAFRQAGHDEAAIEAWFERAPGARPHFDLWRANRDQLVSAGIRPDAIHSSGLCTRTYPTVFHSYRAAGAQAGRMAAVIRANP
jgi:YfiH family protein